MRRWALSGGALIEHRSAESQDLPGSWLSHVRLGLAALLIAGGCWLSAATVTSAHEGGELGIEIPVERIAPGADLPILGAEWAPRARLEVRLRATGADLVTIGQILTDGDGHFATTVPLPRSLPSGMVAIQVVSDYGVLDTAVVTIDPAAPAPSSVPPTGRAASHAGADEVDVVPIVAMIGAVGALAFILRRTRRPEPGARTLR